MRRLESRIRAWVLENPAGSNPIGTDARLVGALPAPLTLEWQDLAARLRSNGVTF